MILSHVVACSENRVIGKDGKIPWHLSADLKYFKQVTMGHCLIMGRKTFESIGKPLPGRFSIVVSRGGHNPSSDQVAFVPSIDKAIALAKELSPHWGRETCIVGGGEIYRQTMNQVDRIYLTLVHEDYDGNTFYPEIDLNAFEQQKADRVEGQPSYSFLVYQRR